MCEIPVRIEGPGSSEVAEKHLVVRGEDFSLPMFDFLPVRCNYNASRPQVGTGNRCFIYKVCPETSCKPPYWRELFTFSKGDLILSLAVFFCHSFFTNS